MPSTSDGEDKQVTTIPTSSNITLPLLPDEETIDIEPQQKEQPEEKRTLAFEWPETVYVPDTFLISLHCSRRSAIMTTVK